MPSLLANYNITPTNTSSVNTDIIATITALSTSVASATNDLLLPALDAKAPKHSPFFTGNVQGVTANMVTATKADNTSSNVQTEINALKRTATQLANNTDTLFAAVTDHGTAISNLTGAVEGKADTTTVTALSNTLATKANTSTVTALSSTVTALSNTVTGKADKTDTVFTGDFVVNPKPNKGLETTLSINSTKTNGNNYSTLYLNSATGNGKLWYNNDLGMAATTTGLPIRLSPGNNEAVVIRSDKTVELMGDLKSGFRLTNNFADKGICSIKNENKSISGISRVELKTGTDTAYIQTGGGTGLLISTEANKPIRFSPNQSEAFKIEGNGTTQFLQDMDVQATLRTRNIFYEKTLSGDFLITHAMAMNTTDAGYNQILFYPDGRYTRPSGADFSSWWNPGQAHFIINKAGVYSIRGQLEIDFTGSLSQPPASRPTWNGQVSVRYQHSRFIAAANTTLITNIERRRFTHDQLARFEDYVHEVTMPLEVGDTLSLWICIHNPDVRFYPINVKQTSYFRIHLLN